MTNRGVDDIVDVPTEREEVQRDLKQAFLSGVAIAVPFIVTVLVLQWGINFVSDALAPLVGVVGEFGPASEMSAIVTEIFAAAMLFGAIMFVGLSAQHGPRTGLGDRIDRLMSELPGIGSIYTSVDRMSEVMIEGDTESFREVKLVEFPQQESFAIAFLTAESPDAIENAAGYEQMQTLFVPMAPNPVMGGHLVNIPVERIHDVDLTVEEGMQAIITTGMAIDESAHDE
ncbi:Uncharacterized membrane protein [Natronoarchaeum philippinense]|uniref:Uncharacterized membrane protein n=1 Tax=Natronoarchaeum philippinense TaxID=558529 RepID=A0A285P7L2_NATPI|nr:DUF502 domain-containing protein [Natronoarchaeum philippinense]SNZ17729.1 Uncharacterized membrane protein [Natronoarchaeum philippinense]